MNKFCCLSFLLPNFYSHFKIKVAPISPYSGLCVGLTDWTRVRAHIKVEMVLIKITGRPGLEPVTHARKRRPNRLSLLKFPDILRYGVCWNVQLSTFLVFFDLDRRPFESAEVLTRSSQSSGPNFRTPQGQPFAETRK